MPDFGPLVRQHYSTPGLAVSPWDASVGAALVESSLTERQFIVVCRTCILHAYAVNRSYFAKRINPERMKLADRVIAAIEDISNVKEFPGDDLREWELRPPVDSAEDIVPGWGSFVHSIMDFVGYPESREPDVLLYAMGNAYMAVSSRAAAEHFGVEGNCGFSFLEVELERQNELCARQIDYQRSLLANACANR